MRMLERYVTLDLEAGRAYINKDRIRDVGKIDAAIFDCDGVLIDIKDSYNIAISKAVAQIFERLTGCKIPEKLISDEIIFLFRRSGGFNNDWDTVYGALMFLLSELPEAAHKRLGETIGKLMSEKSAAKRLLAIKEGNRMNASEIIIDSPENLLAKLREFASLLDATGIHSVDRIILASGKVSKEFYDLLRDFLYGSAKVGESVIPTVFEEIFCGPRLFEEIYGVKPEIWGGRGMIENGRPIIKHETLNRLSSLFGGARFGIASGSRFKSARYTLREILDWFNPKAQIFLDYVENIESEYLKGGLKVSLKKPNPFSLFKSAENLEPFRFTLYVGDSMEDAIMVKEARKLDPDFLFAGVYEHTSMKERVINEFIKFECDLILPSVNDVPDVIEAARSGKI
ncbi:MAG: hypothetical protein QXK89_00130 [Candidatus Bathyarchaeia archaeon]